METLKIKFKKSHPDYAYFAGDPAELPSDAVEALVESGHVILFPGEPEKAINPLPADLPCRDILFDNGFKTVEEITAAGESILQIKGIGKKSFGDIIAFCA